MIINISDHYFGKNAYMGELKKSGKFQVGEIVTDWEGDTGCILMIFKDGSVRTDSNGMGDISKLKKTRSKQKILEYLKHLHKADKIFMKDRHKQELEQILSL